MDAADEEKGPPGPGITKKMELNNHIVNMRQFVRQAKVHVARKLAREISKLKGRKGSEEVQQKAQRKAERLHKDVVTIKDFEENRVSIAALQNQSKLDEVLQNVNSTPEERALIRLIFHPSVQVEVNKYRKENPHWKLQIPVLLERTPQKQKKAEKKQAERQEKIREKRLIRAEVVKPEEATAESSEEEEISDSKAVTTDEEIDSNSENKIQEAEVNVPKKESIKKESIKKELKKKKEVTKAKPEQKSKVVPKFEPNPKQLNPEKLNKIQGTVKVQVIQDWSEFELGPSSSSNPQQELAPTKKPKSSFFLGGVDEPEKEVKPDIKAEKRKLTFGEKVKRNTQKPSPWGSQQEESSAGPKKWKMSQETEPVDTRSKFNKSDKPQRRGGSDKPNQAPRSKPTASKAAAAPASTEKLHPSWEAKKRQSIAITAFQGKKITFGD